MRKSREDQLPLAPLWPDHELGRELAETSRILDECPEISRWIMDDVCDSVDEKRGAGGMTGEQVLRCGVLKQWQSLTYRKLAFHLGDSISFRRFCRLPANWTPSSSCLQANLSKVRAGTWRRVNARLVLWAGENGLEDGRRVRGDATAVAAPIAEPEDSQMLFDCVRVGTRLLKELSGQAGVRFSDHRRRAKRRAVALRTSRKGRRQKDLYRDLLKVAGLTLGYIEEALASVPPGPRTSLLLGELQALAQKMARVIDQTRRRVIEGETVPAREKLFSIFEDHADIIKTGRRDPVFGHKIFLSVGRTSLILDCCIERGNPADSTLFKPMLERLEDLYGRMPDQVSFDGGFASRPNLRWAKEDAGITDVAFAKKRGLKVPEMVRSSWIYQQLKRFRAGIEGCISMFKRVFGADRCTWKGWHCFKRYTQLSVLSYNLLVLARLRL